MMSIIKLDSEFPDSSSDQMKRKNLLIRQWLNLLIKFINQAKGNYIMVLDSDDYFDSTFCKKAINVFLNNKDVKIITSLVNRVVDNKIIDVFKPSGGDIKKFILNKWDSWIDEDFLKYSVIN